MRATETTAIKATAESGRVFLIGAGPGDPKLLTIKAAEAIASSDAVVYDYLVNPEILKHARPDATLIFVGKRAGEQALSQELINSLLIERAALGQTVARLKGGDPFIFGRGGEEAEELTEAGVAWEVIPGISSGVAAAAYAGIPLTHRSYSSSVAFITGHSANTRNHGVDWRAAAKSADTLVIFMCAKTLTNIARELISGGKDRSLPVAIIRWGTYEHQQVYRTTLGELESLDEQQAEFIQSPSIAVVGEVVRLSARLNWFGDPAVELAEAFLEGELFHSEEDKYVAVRCTA